MHILLWIHLEVGILISSSSSNESIDKGACQWEDSSRFAALSALIIFAEGAAMHLEHSSSPTTLVSGAIVLDRQECVVRIWCRNLS